ncbi:DUF5691 domain-containing protein, partial [Cellulomonas shaoxiangyii]
RTDADAPTALLDAAALGAALRAAGAEPAAGRAVPEPCPPDGVPEAPPRAAQVLALVLTQPPVGRELRDALLERCCAAVAAGGRRVPHELLPALLAEGTRRPAVRARVLPVVHARGRWLAARRPEWAWAVGGGEEPQPDDDPAVLRLPSGALVTRLAELRGTDPDRARRLVAAALATTGAETRAALLRTLATGLGPADEPLLEAALDDRAAAVRAAAAAALDGLPTSARAARLAARLTPLVSVHGLLRRRLEVAAPGPLDDAARRDGIGVGPGAARDAAVLSALVTGAPLDVLRRATGTTPAALLRLDGERVLRAAIRRATVAQRDVGWARALLADEWDAAAAAVLPPDEAQAAARRWLASTPADALGSVAHALPGPWDEPLSVAVAEALVRTVADPATTRAPVLPAEPFARSLHPAAREPLARARAAADRAAADAERAVERARDPQESGRLALAGSVFRGRAHALQDLTQHLSLLATIDEALA